MATAVAPLSAGLVNYRQVQVEARSRIASFECDGRQRARWCTVFSYERIRALSRENEDPSPMELWPGVSSRLDFEFGYQKPHEKSLKLDDIQSILGFSELKDSVVQPYMGDVDMPEEEEAPAKYVPPPPVPPEDMEMRNKVEEVMYTLLKCIPGQMATLLHDQEKWDALMKIFSENVEIQDPLICLKGLHSFSRLLNVLCHSGIVVSLHDIYYENIAPDRFKRFIYAIWTATLTNNLEESLEMLNLTEWWEVAYGSLVNHGGECQDGTRSVHAGDKSQDVDDKNRFVTKSARSRLLKLSGESKLQVNEEGEVTSVSSRWFKLSQDDDLDLATAKLWLAGLYSTNGL